MAPRRGTAGPAPLVPLFPRAFVLVHTAELEAIQTSTPARVRAPPIARDALANKEEVAIQIEASAAVPEPSRKQPLTVIAPFWKALAPPKPAEEPADRSGRDEIRDNVVADCRSVKSQCSCHRRHHGRDSSDGGHNNTGQ